MTYVWVIAAVLISTAAVITMYRMLAGPALSTVWWRWTP